MEIRPGKSQKLHPGRHACCATFKSVLLHFEQAVLHGQMLNPQTGYPTSFVLRPLIRLLEEDSGILLDKRLVQGIA